MYIIFIMLCLLIKDFSVHIQIYLLEDVEVFVRMITNNDIYRAIVLNEKELKARNRFRVGHSRMYGQNSKIDRSASAAFLQRACVMRGVGGSRRPMTSHRVAARCDRQLLRNRAPLILTASRPHACAHHLH